MVTKEVELLQKAREQFNSKRLNCEVKLQKFRDIVEPLRATVLADMNIPMDLSLQALIPELYKDRVDIVVYREQLSETQNMINSVKERIVSVNKEAVALFGDAIGALDATMSDADKLRIIREQFITSRAKQEEQVLAFGAKIQAANPELFAGINLPEEITLQRFVPGYYATEFDVDLCKQQYDAMVVVLNQVKAVVESKREEVQQCLSEYLALVSEKPLTL